MCWIFETFFSDDYTLKGPKKLSTEAYIRDPRFEVHGCTIRWPDGDTLWYSRDDDLEHILKNLSCLAQCGLLCHHAHFDGLILSHHYGIIPKAYLCTLSMARLLLGNHVSVSLDSVREHFQMPNKRTPYEKFRGKHWSELDEFTRAEIAAGACDEVASIWDIFNRFMKGDY